MGFNESAETQKLGMEQKIARKCDTGRVLLC